jgi:hypothetical protein
VLQPNVEDKLLALVPCTAREFSDEGSKLVPDPKELGRLKLALGIETVKDPSGQSTRWFCRHVPGYTGPTTTARQDAGLTTKTGYTDSVKFAPLAARAATVSKEKSGGNIGGRAKEKAS